MVTRITIIKSHHIRITYNKKNKIEKRCREGLEGNSGVVFEADETKGVRFF